MHSRRNFIKTVTLSGAALAIPEIVHASESSYSKKKFGLSAHDVILFQGDSITDAGRNKDERGPNNSKALGSGYCMLAAAHLLHHEADKNLMIFNRGISGNKVYQLKERWQTDCLDLKPTVLSIHIGVNDYWHTLSHNYPGTVETYENDYRALLKQTREVLSDIKLIVGEPFAVKDIQAVTADWFPAFDEYRAVARKLADEFEATFVPFHEVFMKAQKHAPGSYWTSDGIHPTVAGASLMAEIWLAALK